MKEDYDRDNFRYKNRGQVDSRQMKRRLLSSSSKKTRSRRASVHTDSGSAAKNKAVSEAYNPLITDLQPLKLPIYGDDSVEFK